jgi:cytochrome c-type biogenesis protein CcmH/NrfF
MLVFLASLAGPFLAAPSWAAPGDPLTPAQEADVDYLTHRLIAPCCWTASVAEHGSGQAPVVEAEVRNMVASGMSRQAIEDHYVAEFGQRILVEPRARGFNHLAYWMPWIAVLVGLGLIFRFTRKGSRDAEDDPTPETPADPYVARVREELRRLD